MRLVKSDGPGDRPSQALPESRLQATFADGFSAVLDLKDHIHSSDWPIVQPLKKVRYFQRDRVKHGSIVWPNDYDVCPDVLRFWCEVVHAASPAETDAHFAAFEQMVA